MSEESPAATFAFPVAKIEGASDVVLMQRIAAGDQFAMRTLVVRHQARLYRFLRRMVRDAALAEDLLSDLLFDVWRQAGSFEGRSSVSTWLLAIGRFKALAALRAPKEVELDNEMAGALPDPADDPEVTLQKKQRAEVLRQCIDALPISQAQIIDLVYYHGKSVSEVAEIMQIAEGTVKTRMFYARKRLASMTLVRNAAPFAQVRR
jgi:RNA polymerase sigma-70 factor (ECF subfamily)